MRRATIKITAKKPATGARDVPARSAFDTGRALRKYLSRLRLPGCCGPGRPALRFWLSDFRFLLLASLCLPAVFAARPVCGQPSVEALKTFQLAQAEFQAHPDNPTNAWQFARACFELGDFSTNNSERAQIANQGIAAARRALAEASNAAPPHYQLGLNLGQLARTKSLGALRLVGQMEREFTTAAALDPHFDYAGPDRSLGLLYRDAPAIGSIGSRSKAKQHLQRALELAPEFPENRLNLIESYMKWNERNTARQELVTLEAEWETARAAFTGPPWAASWQDWEARRQSAKKILGEPPKALESPRH